jgi:hypothetical protein
MATLKCWKERTDKTQKDVSFPPIVVINDPMIDNNSSDKINNQTDVKNK